MKTKKKNSYDLDEQTAEVISFVWSHLWFPGIQPHLNSPCDTTS